MSVPYNFESSSPIYKRYFEQQAGGYLPVFRGKTIQSGGGLSGIFSKIFRTIGPVFKEVAKTAGKQLVHTGANIASDMMEGKNFSESAKQNFSNGGKRLLGNLSSAITSPKKGGAKKRKITKNKGLNSRKSKRRRLNHDIFK